MINMTWYRIKRDWFPWTKEYKLRVKEWHKLKQTEKMLRSSWLFGNFIPLNKKDDKIDK